MTPADGLLWDDWRAQWEQEPTATAVVHWTMSGGSREFTRHELVAAAWGYARRLVAAGVRPGEVCALVLRNRPEFYPLYLGVSLAGAIPAVLAYPNPRLHPDKFRQGLEGMAACSGLDLLLTERDLEPVVRPLVEGGASSVRGLLFPVEWGSDAADFDAADFDRMFRQLKATATPDDPCLLQHSSGTTGLQKGVVLSHRTVREHLRAYGGVLGVGAGDKVASWLPLYHDMGLIAAFHLPLHFGLPLVQLDPFEWVSAPVLLLEAVSRYRATLAWLPNFAYHLLAERPNDEDLEGVRLDSLRAVVNCSEPVRAEAHEKLTARLGPYGLNPNCLTACYAMAETTFAVTQTPVGRPARVLDADQAELGRGRYRPAAGGPARRCVSSGVPIPGTEVRVVGPDGESLPDGRVGELVIASAAMFDGYRNNPLKTAEVLRDGWYRSGDLGFLHDGECFVIGRQKDVIIVAGKNLYPEDVESAVGQVPGVVPGRVVAYGRENPDTGTEDVCVIAETHETDPARLRALGVAVKTAGMGIGVSVARVALVPHRWLFKSSSGKPSRKANQERLADDRWVA
ncbi:MAG TPA: AMP-binding protein [Urbifossiella sp.]|nr:AMP-binding protein [Urbifossiella sp.]